jgi:amino acid transporter
MKRTLGLLPLLAAIYFCVSGGAFGLEPVVALGPGLAVLLIVLTPAVWSVPAALMTAELSCAIPEDGGYILWVRRAMGEPWGFLCGWWSWVSSWVDVAIYPTLFAAYTARFLEQIGYATAIDQNPWLKWSVGLIVIVPFTWLNLRGAKQTGEASVTLLAVLLIPFVLMVSFGMSRVIANPSLVVHPFLARHDSGAGIFGVGLFAAMWNYMGWDSISTVSGEVKEPPWTFPRALALGVPIVVVTYLLPVIIGVVVVRNSTQWDEGAWVQVAALVGGKWLGISMAAAGAVSSAGQFCATLLAGSRIPFVLADRRSPLKGLTKLHPRFGTPWGAILVSAAFYTAFSYESFKDLAVVDVVLYSSALLLELIALAVLRVREPELPRPFRIPGGWPVLWFVVFAPAFLIAFACYSRIHEKGMAAAWLSLAALTTGPIVWAIARGGPGVGRIEKP